MPRYHLDLFSGIGGFALAAQWAGFTTSMFCEIDPFCRQVLNKHWPETPIHDDIRTLTADVVGRPIDLLTGGFPCQPFSVAGKQLGAADDRHLWPEMARVIDECRPRWILGENTPGIIGMELDNCLADLESLGYEAWPVVIPAVGVGAWHQRQRVWIVAHSADGGIRRRIAPREAGQPALVHEDASYSGSPRREGHGGAIGVRTELTGADGDTETSADAERGGRWEPTRTDTAQGPFPETVRAQGAPRTGSGGSDVADANDERLPISESEPREERTTGTSERPRFTGGDWWATESRVRGVPDGLSSGMDRRAARLKALGNAIVPQVAYQILREMA